MSEENTEVVDQETEATEESSDQKEAVEASGEQTQEEAKQEEVKQELLRQIKLKVDGKEEVMELPFDADEKTVEWLKRHVQPVRAAQKRFQEVSNEKKRLEQALSNFKNDPASAMKALGVDAEQFAEQLMIKKLEEQEMTPEQREARKLQNELAQYKAQEKQRKEQEQAAAVKAEQQANLVEYTTQITEALESGGLPKSDATQRKMAEYMLMNQQNNMGLPMASIVDMVREDYIADFQDMLSNASGEQIQKLLGKDTADKLRKSDLAQLKKAPKAKVEEVHNETPKKKKEPDFISPSEFKAYLEKRNKK